MRDTLHNINEKLQNAGYKLTAQREVVLSTLLEKEKDHLSAEEIYFLTKRKNKNIGIATVYRTLEILVELRIVDRVSFTDDGVVLYDLREDNGQHFHSHLHCTSCGDVEEIEQDLLLGVEKLVEEQFQFEVLDHRLTFQGNCKNCRQKEKEKNG